MLKGLFLNTTQENCSIHESGKMCYGNLRDSKNYQLDYLEINQTERAIKAEYDFYVFNYHPWKMDWLDTNSLKNLPGKKYTIVLEVAQNDPFVYVNDRDFDGYIVLDPSIKKNHPKVFPFARPLELEIPVTAECLSLTPTIGSFGFPTPGKGFELLIDAVNKEFEHAVVRINVPPVNQDTYNHCKRLFDMDYTDYLEQLCKKVAKQNIRIEFTRHYFSKEDLINWCASNTLNCFMYNRFQTGLSATTDQAIVSGRPLAISSNETFRHIHQYITPYPYRSLKDSIRYSGPEVQKIKSIWTLEAFRNTFEKMLNETGCTSITKTNRTILLNLKRAQHVSVFERGTRKLLNLISRPLFLYHKENNKKKPPSTNFLLEISRKKAEIETILFVSHSSRKCGIHEFGWNIKEALKKSLRYNFCYSECGSQEDLNKAIEETKPDIVIYNYYHITMPWLDKEFVAKINLVQIGYVHEFDQSNVREKIRDGFFDYYIFPDPSLNLNGVGKCFKTGRQLANYQNYFNIPSIPIIGSFGFGFQDKGFDKLINVVQEEFDEAIIRIIMPFNDIVDPDGTKIVLPTAQRCRELITKPGIQLKISHDYVSKKEILDFLASNTINAFLYDSEKKQGISSVLDYALSVQRPILISSAGMFRHVASISDKITVEKNSLRSVIAEGIAPLVPFYNEWSEPKMILSYESIISTVLENASIVV